MPKPMIKIHDADADTVIEREMTDIEFAEYKKIQESAKLTTDQIELAKTQKQEILDRLGLTESEASLLLG